MADLWGGSIIGQAEPIINVGDRMFWLTVMRMLEGWPWARVFVQPDTVM